MTTTRHFDLAFSNFRKKAGRNLKQQNAMETKI